MAKIFKVVGLKPYLFLLNLPPAEAGGYSKIKTIKELLNNPLALARGLGVCPYKWALAQLPITFITFQSLFSLSSYFLHHPQPLECSFPVLEKWPIHERCLSFRYIQNPNTSKEWFQENDARF